MTSILPRGQKLYAKIRDVNGEWRRVATGFSVGQEAEAKAWAEDIDKRTTVERERKKKYGGPVTVTSYFDKWIEARKTKTVEDDRARITKHVLPRIGSMALADVTPVVMRALVMELRDEGKIGGKTIREVASICHTMFKSALIKGGLIASNPVIFEADVLPKKGDKDPKWRKLAIFTRSEIEQLISDVRIPLRRRIVYAIKFFSGRHTETTLCRWSQYDPTTVPLGTLNLLDTKTTIPRDIPVHPAFATILEWWRDVGWEAAYGRPPTESDLIVQSPRGLPLRASGTQKQFVADLAKLGLRTRASSLNRRGHDLRRTFITLARADGAIDSLLRWVTHGPKPGEMLDIYSSPPWSALCAEVMKLQIELRSGFEQLAAPRAPKLLGPGPTPILAATEPGPPLTWGDARLPPDFWANCTPEPNSGCWLWVGPLGEHGGPRLRSLSARRMALRSTTPQPDEAAETDIRCRQLACVNPGHLAWASPKDAILSRSLPPWSSVGPRTEGSSFSAALLRPQRDSNP